jgi:hypothetical protein
MSLSAKQGGVLKGMAIGAAITVVTIVVVILKGPLVLSAEAPVGDRIAFALKADAWLALWLGISVALLARHRFFTPEDIDGGGLTNATETARVLQASLQNTLEQTVLAVLLHVAWAILMPASWLAVIPAVVILFLWGRVSFLRGYRGGAPSRALGFALTFYPSVLMLILVIVRSIENWFA